MIIKLEKPLLNQNFIDLSILLILYDNLLASALFEYLMLKMNNFFKQVHFYFQDEEK